MNSGGVEATEIPTGPPGNIRFKNHVEKARPQRGRTANNTGCFHLEKLLLGGSQFPRIQTANFGKNWRTRDGGQVMENYMLRCRG